MLEFVELVIIKWFFVLYFGFYVDIFMEDFVLKIFKCFFDVFLRLLYIFNVIFRCVMLLEFKMDEINRKL